MFVRADRHVPVPLPHALLRRGELQAVAHCDHVEIRDGVASVDPDDATWLPCAAKPEQIGRAHVCTPVTNAHLVCRLLLAKKKKNKLKTQKSLRYTKNMHHSK